MDLPVDIPDNRVTYERPPKGLRYSFGLRNSNRMKYAVTVAGGFEVAICNNGMITGTRILSRKHTTGVDLGRCIKNSVDDWVRNLQGSNVFVRNLQNTEISDRLKDHILMEAMRAGAVASGQLKLIDAEYQEPQYTDFQQKTAWALYNAFTTVSQQKINDHARQRPSQQFDSMAKFTNVISGYLSAAA